MPEQGEHPGAASLIRDTRQAWPRYKDGITEHYRHGIELQLSDPLVVILDWISGE